MGLSSAVSTVREAPDVPEVEDVVFELDPEAVESPKESHQSEKMTQSLVLALPLALKSNLLVILK